MKDDRGGFDTRSARRGLALGASLISVLLISGCAVTKMSSSPAPTPGAGQLAVNPTSMNFGTVNVGASTNRAGTIIAGSSSITVSSASWNGTGYSLGGITFPVTIPAGQSVPFTVTFAPQVAGNVPGSVSFLSNATNSPSAEQWTGIGAQTGQHSVALSWDANTPGVQGYYVYRAAHTGGPYSQISGLQGAPAYIDSAVSSGQTYYYVVTALGTNFVESGYSNEAVAIVP
jgi:hypothetical protein